MHRPEQTTSPDGSASHRRWSPLRRLSHFLARLPASGYALLFLVSIPLFAALYHYVFPNDFYSATVTHEAYYHRELVGLQSELQETLIADLGAAYGTYAVPLEDGSSRNRLLCVDRLQILTFTITGAGIASMNVAFPTAPATPDTVWCSRDAIDGVEVLDAAIGFPEAFTPDYFALPGLAVGGQPWLALVFTSTESQDAAARLFPPPPSTDTLAVSADRLLVAIAVTPRLAGHTREVFDSNQGNPSSLPGGYWRMLYISAVATTTTGFGDIVPITTRARIITIAEIFVGMVLVGLFLNALAVRRGVA